MTALLPASYHAHDPSPSRRISEPRHLDFIDALRGVALIAVVVFHLALRSPALPRWISVPASQGVYGVQLFYVISAFTLFSSLAQRSGNEPRPVLSFFLRRFFRIAPMFWVAIVAYVLLHTLGHDPNSRPLRWWHVLTTAAFAHGWHPATINRVVPGGWSVAVEMLFYLAVPLLFRFITTPRRAVAAFLITTLLGRTASIAMKHAFPRYAPGIDSALAGEFTYYWLPAQAPIFCLGFVLHFAFRNSHSRNGGSPPPGRATAVGLLALAAILAALFTILPTMAYVGFGVAFLFLAWGLSLWAIPLLVNPLTRFVGQLSYSAYLVHFAVMEVALSLASAWTADSNPHAPMIRFAIALALTLAGTTLISLATFSLIEEPGRKLGKRVILRCQGTRPTPRTNEPSLL